MTEKLFVYGSLQDPAVQMQLVGRTISGEPDTLTGFRRYSMLQYPFILPSERHSVEGQVLTITADELAKMDMYEGSTYLRIRVTLNSGTETWVYQGDPAVYGRLTQGV
jgi:gamma-glutamylcyclotransferase (GGCT)/AIG2-like uncharacterized protein YtfP